MVTVQKTSAKKDPGSLQGRQAEELFPDFFQKTAPKQYTGLAGPPPPDDRWAESEVSVAGKDATGLHALVLVCDAAQRHLLGTKLQHLGYATAAVHSAEQALDELHTASYQLIVCGTDAAYRAFHNYLSRSLPSQRRRLLYYVLIGPDVHTCYGLQALALSANLVVNERELPFFEAVLHKGFKEYRELFAPFLEVLGENRLPVPSR